MSDHALILLTFLLAVIAVGLAVFGLGVAMLTVPNHPDRSNGAKVCFGIAAGVSLLAAYFFWFVSATRGLTVRISIESVWVVATFVGLFAGFRFASRSLIRDSVPETKTSDAPKISFEPTKLSFERYADNAQYMLPRFTYNTGVGPSPEIEVKANPYLCVKLTELQLPQALSESSPICCPSL